MLVMLVLAAACVVLAAPAGGTARRGATVSSFDLVGGQYTGAYRPTTIVDTGGPANWQTRQPITGAAGQYDLQRVEFGEVMVDADVIARVPLAGLSTLPADPTVIGPAGVTTLDPADYRDVFQVDLVFGGSLAELPPGQAIGFGVLRTVTGVPTYNGPGTEFHGMSVADRYATNSGLMRIGVDGATNRFVGGPSNTVLFLMGNRARLWIPMAAVQGTTAIQGNVFQPGVAGSDTSKGEPGSTDVLTPVDLARLPSTRLVSAPEPKAAASSPVATTDGGGGGGNQTFWIVVLASGAVLVVAGAAFRFAPMFAGAPVALATPVAPVAPATSTTAVASMAVRPCEEERIAAEAAKRACDQARFDAAAADADAADARAELDRLREEYPPLDWQDSGRLDADMDTGEHVTHLDMRLGAFAASRAPSPPVPQGSRRAEKSRRQREDARREYDEYQAKAEPLRDRVRRAEEAKARFEDACAKAAAAQAAYEACMGLHSTPDPAPAPIPTPVGTGGGNGAGGGAGSGGAGSGAENGGGATPVTTADTPSPGTTTRKPYEPPKVTSPGPVVVVPPPPPGGCTEDRVIEVCPPETFKVGRTLVLSILGSGRYDNDWRHVAQEFDGWAASNGYLSDDSTQANVAGADVGALLMESKWKGMHATVVVTAQVLYEEVTLACRRTYPCVNGRFGPPVTTTKRVRQQRYSAPPHTLGDLKRDEVVDAAAMVRFLRNVWGPFATGQQASEEFVARCH
jgi:hypothetical protein